MIYLLVHDWGHCQLPHTRTHTKWYVYIRIYSMHICIVYTYAHMYMPAYGLHSGRAVVSFIYLFSEMRYEWHPTH